MTIPCVILSALVWTQVCGCASLDAAPSIAPLEGSENVIVVPVDGEQQDSCTFVATSQITDGLVSSGRSAYRGTLERAYARLRNEAVMQRANVAKVVDFDMPLIIDSPGARGQRVWLMANLYSC